MARREGQPEVLCRVKGTVLLPRHNAPDPVVDPEGWEARLSRGIQNSDILLMRQEDYYYLMASYRDHQTQDILVNINLVRDYEFRSETYHLITDNSGRKFALHLSQSRMLPLFVEQLSSVFRILDHGDSTRVTAHGSVISESRSASYLTLVAEELVPRCSGADAAVTFSSLPRSPPCTDVDGGDVGADRQQIVTSREMFDGPDLAGLLQEAIISGRETDASHWAKHLARLQANVTIRLCPVPSATDQATAGNLGPGPTSAAQVWAPVTTGHPVEREQAPLSLAQCRPAPPIHRERIVAQLVNNSPRDTQITLDDVRTLLRQHNRQDAGQEREAPSTAAPRAKRSSDESWTCRACTFLNENNRYACGKCDTKRKLEAGFRKTVIVNCWSCKGCTFENHPLLDKCEVCGHEKA